MDFEKKSKNGNSLKKNSKNCKKVKKNEIELTHFQSKNLSRTTDKG